MLKNILPLLIIFVVTTILAVALGSALVQFNITSISVIITNVVLFLLTTIALMMHINAAKSSNPNVLVRSVMMATLIKFFVVAISSLIFFSKMDKKQLMVLFFIAMILYIAYTIVEIKAALKQIKK